MKAPRLERYEGTSVLTNGVADLMTSLAVIFLLLLAVFLARGNDESSMPTPPGSQMPEARQPIDPEITGPRILTLAVPDSTLEFDFGKSALSSTTMDFLTTAMPHYASLICGPEGQDIEAFVIEGYTDDLGDDLHNLRLSQDRSFAVLAKSLEIVHAQLPSVYECFLQKTTANGRGRQQLLRNEVGNPDRDRSRRVIFKIYRRPL